MSLIQPVRFDDVKLPGSEGSKANGKSGEKRPPTQYWLNVGVVRGTNGNEKLLTLPQGIPLDGLEARSIPSQKTNNQDFRNMRIAEAQLWKAMQELIATLKPGESRRVDLVCEIRRIDEKAEVTDDEVATNPYALGEFKL